MPSSEVASASGPVGPMAQARRLDVPQSTAIQSMFMTPPLVGAIIAVFRGEGQLRDRRKGCRDFKIGWPYLVLSACGLWP